MRRKKRAYRTITCKLYEDIDADLIAFWDAVPGGERSDMLKNMMRGYRPSKCGDNLTQIQQDTQWIREALLDLPAYLERILKDVSSRVVVAAPQAASAQPTEPSLSEQDKTRRANRMSKASW